MEIEGKIILKLDPEGGVSKAGNTWKKQAYVLETQGQYPRKVKFDFFGDRVESNQLEVGKNYIISYDLESREFNGRWYTDVRAFASRPSADNMTPGNFPQANVGFPQSQPGFPAQPAATAPETFGVPAPEQGPDDLPF